MVSGPSATKAPRVRAVRAVPGRAGRGSGSGAPVGAGTVRVVRSCIVVTGFPRSSGDAGPTLAETPVLLRQVGTAGAHSGWGGRDR